MPFLTLLTAAELADAFGMSKWTVGRLRREHGLPAVNVGGVYRYDPDEVRAWLDARKTRQ